MSGDAIVVREIRRTRLVVGRTSWCAAALVVALGVTMIVAAGRGQLGIPPSEVLGSVAHRLGLDLGLLPRHANGEAVLWQVRFPRVVMAAVVGAALGLAGALMQGLFRNPLAEPAVVGVSAGAAVGACTVIVTGLSFAGPMTLPGFAFVGGLLTTILVYRLSRTDGRSDVAGLVLMGIAVNAAASGLVSLLVFVGDRQAREQIVFWQLGSLNGSRWDAVAAMSAFGLVGGIGALSCARRLDLLALGERTAAHLGVDVERVRWVGIASVALLVGPAVASSGIIGFVGLVVAHMVRLVVGPGHRALLPLSMLTGAVVLVWADLVARTAVDYADLPIGMLTALIGGPVFFWLLRRTRRSVGGWA